MIFESALDELMENIGRKHLVDVCTWKVIGKWLSSISHWKQRMSLYLLSNHQQVHIFPAVHQVHRLQWPCPHALGDVWVHLHWGHFNVLDISGTNYAGCRIRGLAPHSQLCMPQAQIWHAGNNYHQRVQFQGPSLRDKVIWVCGSAMNGKVVSWIYGMQAC